MKSFKNAMLLPAMLWMGLSFAGCSSSAEGPPTSVDESQKKMKQDMDKMSRQIPKDTPAEGTAPATP